MFKIKFNKSLCAAGAFGVLAMNVNSALGITEFEQKLKEEAPGSFDMNLGFTPEGLKLYFQMIQSEVKRDGILPATMKSITLRGDDEDGESSYYLLLLNCSRSKIDCLGRDGRVRLINSLKWGFFDERSVMEINPLREYCEGGDRLPVYGKNLGEAIAKVITYNDHITCLDLSRCKIDDSGVQPIANALKVNSSLVSINLAQNIIGTSGARDLADALKINTSLTGLNLSWNKIGDEGAKAFADTLRVNSSLIMLCFELCGIGDEGAEALANVLIFNPSLVELDLPFNEIGDIGAGALADALMFNRTLISLDLQNNSIGDYGAMLFASVLRFNNSLIRLNLSKNPSISKSARNALADVLDFFNIAIIDQIFIQQYE